MYKIAAFLLLFSIGTLTAQEDLQKEDYPKAGMSGLYRSATPTPLKTLADVGGTEQTWDYTTLSNTQQNLPIYYLPIIEATAEDKEQFPNATFFRPKTPISNVKYFYSEDENSYNQLGFFSNNQYYKLGTGIEYYPWPLKYNQAKTSKFAFEDETNGEGIAIVTYDGTGTLMLPGKEFEDVYRLKLETKTVFPDDKTDTIHTVEYQYIERGTGLLLFNLREISQAENPEQHMYVYEYYVQAITSVNEELSDATKIYPNPASNFISVEIPNSIVMDYEIIDINGYVVSKSLTGNNIDISKLTSGTYFIKAQMLTDGIVIKKFVKQ